MTKKNTNLTSKMKEMADTERNKRDQGSLSSAHYLSKGDRKKIRAEVIAIRMKRSDETLLQDTIFHHKEHQQLVQELVNDETKRCGVVHSRFLDSLHEKHKKEITEAVQEALEKNERQSLDIASNPALRSLSSSSSLYVTRPPLSANNSSLSPNQIRRQISE